MNIRSLEAYTSIRDGRPSQKQQILDEYLLLGSFGSPGEEVTRKLFGAFSDNTSTARLSELKGVSLGHSISLVRTGEVRQLSVSQLNADVLIHVAYATTEQVKDHIAWVMEERKKRIADYEAWIQKVRHFPPPIVSARAVKAKNETPIHQS